MTERLLVMGLTLFAAGITGLSASLLARRLACVCRRAWGQPNLMPQIAGDLRKLVTGTETGSFLREYFQLFKRLGQLAAIQFALLLTSLLTLTTFYAASCWLWDSASHTDFVYIALTPPRILTVHSPGGTRVQEIAPNLFAAPSGATEVTIRSGEKRVATVAPSRKQAYARSPLMQAGLVCLGFSSLTIDTQQASDVAYCVARPTSAQFNPLWPWLSDVECSFLLAAAAGSILGPLVIRQPA